MQFRILPQTAHARKLPEKFLQALIALRIVEKAVQVVNFLALRRIIITLQRQLVTILLFLQINTEAVRSGADKKNDQLVDHLCHFPCSGIHADPLLFTAFTAHVSLRSDSMSGTRTIHTSPAENPLL